MDAEIIKWLVQQAPVVVVMGIVIYAIWKQYISERDYARAQEKLMVDVLNQMSNLLNKIGDSEKETTDLVDDVKTLVSETKTLVDIRTSELITLMKSKNNVKEN